MIHNRSQRPRRGSHLTRRASAWISTCVVLLPVAASAAEYVDTPYAERRAFSLFLGPGAAYTESIDQAESKAVKGGDAHLDLGASHTVGYDGDEVFVLIRGGLRGPDLSVAGGYRSFFGDGAWQTFYGLGLLIRPFSGPWLGPRVALGARHTFSDQLAVFGGLGLSLGFIAGLRGDAEAFTGVQWIFPAGSK